MFFIVKLCLSLKSMFFRPTRLLEFELKLFSWLYSRNAIVVQCVLLVYFVYFITTNWMQSKINLTIINIFELHMHQTLNGHSWLSLVHKD